MNERGSGRAVAPKASPSVRSQSLRWWRCEPCGLAYLHARLLATHMMNIHGEPREPATR